jgi:hypothetical protein
MSNDIAVLNTQSPAVAEYFRSGNVAGLAPQEKDVVLAKLCERYGLDVILRPFELISFKGCEKFYMTASATNQLAAQKQLSRTITKTEIDPELGIARCYVEARDPSGRIETGSAALSIMRFQADKTSPTGVKKVIMDGEEMANTINKLETKAKRRVTLAFFGVPDGVGEDAAQLADIPRAQVMADAEVAQEITKISPPQPQAIASPVTVDATFEVPTATPVVVTPATAPTIGIAEPTPEAPKARRGRQAKAVVTEVVEAVTPTASKEAVEAAVANVAGLVKAEVAAQAVAAPVVPPTPPSAYAATNPTGVKYERAIHSDLFMRAVTLAIGNESWKRDESMRVKAKSLIPLMDKNYIIANTPQDIDPTPEFVAVVKKLLQV